MELNELKKSFDLGIKALINKLNCKLSNGYLNIIAIAPIETLKTLKSQLLELNELGVAVELKFNIDKVRIKENNKYIQIDKKMNISVLLTKSNFNIDSPIKWIDSNGIEQTAKITNFTISLFSEYVNPQNIELNYITL